MQSPFQGAICGRLMGSVYKILRLSRFVFNRGWLIQRAGIARRQSGVLGKHFFTTSATRMRGPGIFSARCVIIVTGFWLIFWNQLFIRLTDQISTAHALAAGKFICPSQRWLISLPLLLHTWLKIPQR